MIHGPPWGHEAAKTERAAIRGGWGPTCRLLAIRLPGLATGIAAVVVAISNPGVLSALLR